jgi:hypothetical protein
LESGTINDNIRITSMMVMEAKSVLDRNQLPQWELTVRWEWTPATNTWGERVWVYKDRSPEVINRAMYTVRVERGNIKKRQGGEYWDGTQDWMYNWKVLEFDAVNEPQVVAAPLTAPAAPVAPVQQPPQPPQSQPQAPVIQRAPAESIDDKQMMIMRQSTLNYASILMAPMAREFSSPDLMVQRTIQISSKLLDYVITGKMEVSDPMPDGFFGDDIEEPPVQEAF